MQRGITQTSVFINSQRSTQAFGLARAPCSLTLNLHQSVPEKSLLTKVCPTASPWGLWQTTWWRCLQRVWQQAIMLFTRDLSQTSAFCTEAISSPGREQRTS